MIREPSPRERSALEQLRLDRDGHRNGMSKGKTRGDPESTRPAIAEGASEAQWIWRAAVQSTGGARGAQFHGWRSAAHA